MNQIKSLAEQIRQRQMETGTGKKSEVSKGPPAETEQVGAEVGLIEEIRECGQGESLSQMVHIRLSPRDYRKLITLGAARLSTQKLALYAIRQLLEHDEIKQQLKQLIDELD